MKLARPPFGVALTLVSAAATGTAFAQDLTIRDAPPAPPTGLFANAYSGTAAGVAWMPAEDDVGISGYEVTLDGEIVQENDARSYIGRALTPATAYRVGVTAIDSAGQRSETAFIEFSTEGGTSSGAGPAPVEGLGANVYSSTALGLIWTRPNTFLLRYEISRDGEVIGETNGVTFVDTGLAPGDYVYEVVAIDRDGARSEPVALDVSTVDGTVSAGGGAPVDDGTTDGDGSTPPTDEPDDTGGGDAPDTDGDGVTDDADPTPGDPGGDSNTIISLAFGTEALSTLSQVLAGYPDLVGPLNDDAAELTVFAPTDEAFSALDLGELSVADIENVLEYHVVVGTAFNTLALDADTAFPLTLETAQGGTVEIVDDGDGSLSVVDAAGTVVGIDTVVDSASNGVVYVIDTVLTPPADADEGTTDDDMTDDGMTDDGTADDGVTDDGTTDGDLTDDGMTDGGTTDDGVTDGDTSGDDVTDGSETDESPTPIDDDTILGVAAGAGTFNSLIQVLGGYPDLVGVLGDEDAELVVFAPTDDAFAATDLGGLGVDGIENVLAYHVVTGATFDLSAEGNGVATTTLTTAQGGTLDLVADGTGGLTVIDAAGNSVPVEATVDAASNGLILVIGSVLSPPSAAPTPPAVP